MTNVTALASHPRFAPREVEVSLSELEKLAGVGRTFIFERIVEGMPRQQDDNGHNWFLPSLVLQWFEDNGYLQQAQHLSSVGLGHNTPATGGNSYA